MAKSPETVLSPFAQKAARLIDHDRREVLDSKITDVLNPQNKVDQTLLRITQAQVALNRMLTSRDLLEKKHIEPI